MLSDPEIILLLRQLIDKISKLQTIYSDHVSKQEVDIPTNTDKEIEVDAYFLKLTAKNSDIIVNFDKSTDQEGYMIIRQDSFKIITRPTAKIYARSLNAGGKLTIEGLKLYGV